MRKTAWILHTACCLILTLTAGCISLPIPQRVSEPRPPLSEKLLHYYDYTRRPMQAKFESTEQKSGYQLHRLSLSPADPPEGFRPIKVDWYQPTRAGRHPVVLMSPILAGNDLYVQEFAHFFAARGMHAVLVYRQKEVFSPDRPLEEIETHFKESIVELRETIDWLEQLDSVDPEKIGCFAISLGAILTTVLTPVEPRIRCAVLGLPAGHIPEIILSSDDKAIRKRRRAYLEKHNWTKEQALQRLQSVIVSEPLSFAPSIDPGKTLVIAGLFDRVLGLSRTLELWRAMHRPRLILLPTGHYTAYFATGYLKMATYSFLKRQLDKN